MGVPKSYLPRFDTLVKFQISIEHAISSLATKSTLADVEVANLDVRTKLKDLMILMDRIEIDAEEEDLQTDRDSTLEKLREHKVRYKQLEASLRKANLKAKANIDQKAISDKEELLKGVDLRQRPVGSDRTALRAAHEATEGLRRMTKVMADETERSGEILRNLDDSSRLLTQTRDEYRGLNSVLRNTQQILTKLHQRDLTDKLLLFFGLLVFALVVLYILKKRLWGNGSLFGWVWWLLGEEEVAQVMLAPIATTTAV